MVTAQFGTLNEFNASAESITAYRASGTLFLFKLCSTRQESSPFFSIVGPTVYSTLRDLFAPTSPKDKTLRQIFDRLKLHFEPERTDIVTFTNTTKPHGNLMQAMKLLSEILPQTVHLLLTSMKLSVTVLSVAYE